MPPRRPRFHLIDLLLAVAFFGLASALLQWVRSIGRQGQSFGPFLLIEVGFIAWFITWKTIRLRRTAPECVECGRRFVPPKETNGPAICPRCHQRSLGPAQLKKERAKGLRAFLVLVAIVTTLVGFVLSGPVAARSGRYYWIALPLAAVGCMMGLLAALAVIVFVFFLVRNWRMRNEGYALAFARKVAGSEGEVVRAGPMTIWYPGATDPVATLMAQMEDVRARFEARLGEPSGSLPPVRLFLFDRRDAFVAYHRQAATGLWNLDGLYASGPGRTMTLTSEIVPYRLGDPERTARSLFAFYLMEATLGSLPPPWLQQGIANSLAGGGGDVARLNRNVVASLARDESPGAELFQLRPRDLIRLVRGWYDHRSFTKFARFNAQSWSLVEYLSGEDAPEERRGRFRSFLEGLRAKEPQEAVFERHFGHGFVRLVELWRAWVQERGVGPYELPPPQVRDALLGRVIPIIGDGRAKAMDRIQAIRDVGRAGYATGADALIGLLRAPGEIPQEEVIWSLEAISGLTLGDDPDRWLSWYSELPREIIGQVAEPSPYPVS